MYSDIVSGAVLAGGRSRRMGKDKSQLQLCGRSFLEIQVEKLRDAGIEDIMVSVAYDADTGGIRTVKDEYPDRGPLAAIASVLAASEAPYCFVLSVDAVLVRRETIAELAELAVNNGSYITLLASEKGPQPLIGVYKKELEKEARDILENGKGAVRELFLAHRPLVLLRDDSDEELLNCNTPEDYARILEVFKDKTAPDK